MNNTFNHRELWVALNTETKTVEQIAKEMNTTLATVFKYLKKFNLSYIHILRPQEFKKGRSDPNKGKRLIQFCPKGHDTFVYGRSINSQCNVCKMEYYKPKGRKPKNPICKRGHNKDVVGRTKTGACIECGKITAKERKIKNPLYRKIYKEKNKTHIEAQNKEYREKNKDKIFDRELRRKYGIGLIEYNKLMELQQSKCLICKRHQSKFKKKFAVDHDHSCCPTSGKSCGKCIRGLLCTDCNILLGNARENIETLQGAIDYLKRYKGEMK